MEDTPKEDPRENGDPIIKVEDEKPAESLKVNGRGRTGSDPDAQEMVIASLRSQIQDLFSQVTQLNGKLVKSYDRVSDLEDELHVASSNLRSSSLKISQLELERTQHLSALNTGLLVEKTHVTAELTRLMEKATEEAAQRGQAENARADIEKDLDDLSATLFGQANSMVAEARYAQHLSNRKVEEAERALKGAEEAVGIMQQQMQALQADKEYAEKEAEKMQVVMGKGKWAERQDDSNSVTRSIRLLSTHVPYQEFLMFVAHLRSIHPSAPHPPAITTLLPLPFLARLLNEDSEPTVRLDLAPSLNWLSRRSVLSAIHNGQLTIEPISSATLLLESTSTNIPGLNSSNNNISCALCGIPIFSTPDTNTRSHASSMIHINSNSVSWSTSLFKKSGQSTNYSMSTNTSQPPSPPRSINQGTSLYPPQVYIFRLTTTTNMTSIPISTLPKTTPSGASSSTVPHHPENTSSPLYGSPNPQSTTIYPLCPNTWCLARLRTTCSLWAFVRTGIVERVWEEEVPNVPPPSITTTSNGEKPPIPPRRRGLWGMASALGERAASWSEGDKDKAKKTQHTVSASASASLTPEPVKHKDTKEKIPKNLPPPPPNHPIVAAAHAPVRHSVPPPLPKRSEVRRQPSPTKLTAESDPIERSETPPATEDKEIPAPLQSPITAQPPPPSRSPHRTNTPSNVPLPESRPQTPVPVPGGAIPPPLPRRAAARATRPGGSRPATPALTTEATETPSPTKTTSPEGTMNKAEGATQAEPVIGPVGENEKPPNVDVVPDAVIVPESSAVPSDIAALNQLSNIADVVAVLPSPAAQNVLVDTEAEGHDGGTEATDAQDKKLAKVEANGVVDKEAPIEDTAFHRNEAILPQTEDSKEEQSTVDPKGDSDKETSSDDAKQESENAMQQVVDRNLKEQKVTQAKEPKSDEDKDMYIGDTTWEEKTWKELIRLREEMFWARVGAMRP
ncbi:hypothetical protein BDZ94DRAFT_1304979 [Collybia nuda]|uniref:GDP/GTP exchange factor Sec2 N-terminal domain-containing protein n=1 Tax=Collybia nuda TaxID=64659 RepID=A0A9P6CIU9_9AGAR|nr:hypothetical protein BDZ94DRAFT_1304979 [Collybia nuda]